MAEKRVTLSDCRKKLGTQKFVASQIGISTVYLRMIENGTFTPGRDLMFKLERFFNKPVEDLFPDYFQNDKV